MLPPQQDGNDSEFMWPERRPITATRKPFKKAEVRSAPWSYYEQWDGDRGDMWNTANRRTYNRHKPQPELRIPEFSVSERKDIGTKEVEKLIGLEELKARGIPYSTLNDADKVRHITTNSVHYTKPDIMQVRLEPRAGTITDDDLAPGYSRTSKGLLPGKTVPGAKFDGTTTYRADMRRRPMPPRTLASFTLSWGNALGSDVSSITVPPQDLTKTHFELGREAMVYRSASTAVHTRQEPGTGQQALKAFGGIPQVGDNGTEYNIIHGGAPLPPSRYYDPSQPMGMRTSWRPPPQLPAGERYNTITGEPQNW